MQSVAILDSKFSLSAVCLFARMHVRPLFVILSGVEQSLALTQLHAINQRSLGFEMTVA